MVLEGFGIRGGASWGMSGSPSPEVLGGGGKTVLVYGLHGAHSPPGPHSDLVLQWSLPPPSKEEVLSNSSSGSW